MRRFLTAAIFILPSLAAGTVYRGNLNVNYLGRESGPIGSRSSTFGQVFNFYIYDRLFYSNDLSLGTYIFHNKISNQEHGDLRVRYTANLSGYRYVFYSSYLPYTTQHSGIASEKIRIFQATLGLQPKLLSEISASYTSNKQFSSDNPRTKSGISRSWNIGTQFSKAFGSFQGIVQMQQVRGDLPIKTKQDVRTINAGYSIAKQFPTKLSWSASYNYSNSRNKLSGKQAENSDTHTGAIQANRGFGRWVNVGVATSEHYSNFERSTGDIQLEDFLANGSINIRPRDGLTLVVFRGYSINRARDDTTTELVNDYVNLGGTLEFPSGPRNGGHFSISRSVYFRSALGRTSVDNAALSLDVELYRQTTATINLGLAHSEKTSLNLGRYQMTRTIDLISRPMGNMTLNLNYQSSLVSRNVNFRNRASDNISLSISHLPRPYFNYSVTYTRSTFSAADKNLVSSLSLAANWRLASNFSTLGTYTIRKLGRSGVFLSGGSDRSASGRITWNMTRRSSVTVNYGISGINSPLQSQSYGGYYTWNF